MDNDSGEGDENYEPQVTSSNPEERKLARRLRIQRRIEAIQKQHDQEGQPVILQAEKSLLDKQTESSASVLEQFLLEGDEAVTNVRVGNETREVNRRAKETAKRAEILEQIENESKAAEELFAKIADKWDIIAKYKDPLDISDSINSQKDLCNDLIKQKDEIIAMLKEEIETAELRYVSDQEIQNEDIAELVRRIDKQVDLMRAAYKKELKAIEDTIILERQLLLEMNNKKWDGLHKQRNQNEESNMIKKIQMADEFLQVFYDTRVANEEIFRQTKINLENEVEELQLEFEQLKANCLLNGEKLDYNYNILRKREEENLIIRSQQKRMINKLQDSINNVKKHMREYKEKSEETISKLVNEIKKIRDSVFQVENKADHICNVNDRTYHEVWDLNEEKAIDLVHRIRMTDKIIHEQLLGVEWKPPTKSFMKKSSLSSYKEAVEEIKNEKQGPTEKIRTSRLIFPPVKSKRDFVSVSLMKSVLNRISFRSGFLIEKALVEILPELADDTSELIKMDNVFSAIGVTKGSQLKVIADLFLPYARCPVCEAILNTEKQIEMEEQVQNKVSIMPRKSKMGKSFQDDLEVKIDLMKGIREDRAVIEEIVNSEMEEVMTSDSESSGSSSSSSFLSGSTETGELDQSITETKNKWQPMQCSKDHPIYIENVNVYKLLKTFIKMGGNNEDTLTLEKRLQRKRNSISRLISEEDVVHFWNQFTGIFTKHHEDLWNGLLFGMKKYHAILDDRFKTYKAVVKLRKENAELRHMLKYCNFEKKKPTKKKQFMKRRVVSSTPNLDQL